MPIRTSSSTTQTGAIPSFDRLKYSTTTLGQTPFLTWLPWTQASKKGMCSQVCCAVFQLPQIMKLPLSRWYIFPCARGFYISWHLQLQSREIWVDRAGERPAFPWQYHFSPWPSVSSTKSSSMYATMVGWASVRSACGVIRYWIGNSVPLESRIKLLS